MNTHDLFAEPRKVAGILVQLPCQWLICGGWAIDLFLDRQTRQHKDVDVAVLRPDQVAIQAYLQTRGWSLDKALHGMLTPWQPGEVIALPVHTIWCKHATADPPFVELLFNEANTTHWLFRRDQTITRPLAQIAVQTPSGIPIVAPEIVLLYKASSPDNESYTADFLNVVPHLTLEQRAWLCVALTTMYSEHPWLQYSA